VVEDFGVVELYGQTRKKLDLDIGRENLKSGPRLDLLHHQAGETLAKVDRGDSSGKAEQQEGRTEPK
jgi:hypothetical protein